MQSFTSQIFGVIGPLGFDIQRIFDHETPKIKLCLVIALKCYLNDKSDTGSSKCKDF